MTKILPDHPRLRRYAKCLLILAGCIVIFYTVEYWRGWHQWNTFRKEWEAKGENFDRPEIISIPDDQNAAKAPIMQELTDIWLEHPDWFIPVRKPTPQDRGRLDRFGKALVLKPVKRRGGDIANCTKYQLAEASFTETGTVLSSDESEAAQEILARFEEHSSLIDEIDTMLTRPSLMLPAIDRTDAHSTTPPHATALSFTARAFLTRARAQLHLRYGALALADLNRGLLIGKLLREERSYSASSWVVSVSVFHQAIAVIWEGLLTESWDAEELKYLRDHLNNIDFAPQFLAHLRTHRSSDIEAATDAKFRALYNEAIDLLNEKNPKMAPARGFSDFEPLRPQGWRYMSLTQRLKPWQNAIFSHPDGSVNTDELTFRMVQASEPLESSFPERNAIQKFAIAAADRVGIKYRPNKESPRSLPEFGASATVLVRSQFQTTVYLRLAQTAIALERFHFDEGHYPQSLSELTPRYLPSQPIDPWDGENHLRYTLRPAGRPALWSIGENQTDDNGLIDEDDLIWHYEIAPNDPEHPDRIAERRANDPRQRNPAKQLNRRESS